MMYKKTKKKEKKREKRKRARGIEIHRDGETGTMKYNGKKITR